jgi:hypothetical protein
MLINITLTCVCVCVQWWPDPISSSSSISALCYHELLHPRKIYIGACHLKVDYWSCKKYTMDVMFMYFGFNELQYERKFVRYMFTRGVPCLWLCLAFSSCFLVCIFNQINSSCLTVGSPFDASLSISLSQLQLVGIITCLLFSIFWHGRLRHLKFGFRTRGSFQACNPLHITTCQGNRPMVLICHPTQVMLPLTQLLHSLPTCNFQVCTILRSLLQSLTHTT